MSMLTPIGGKNYRISVCATEAGTYVLLKGMNVADKTLNRSVESVDTFDALNAFSEPGPREKGYHVEGLLIPDDPGQLLLRGFEATDAAFWIKILPAGGSADAVENVRGFTHKVKCGSVTWGARTTGAQTYGVDLTSQADEVVVGAGGFTV